jgi:uncharacterized membrane protein
MSQQQSTWSLPMKAAWGLMAALVLVLLLWSVRYFTFNPEVYFERQRDVYEAETLGLMLHIGGMMVAAAMGPFQFIRSFRNRHVKVHRTMGKLYLAGAAVGGLGGLYMAQFSASGIVSDIGFALLAVLLLITTGMAYIAIRNRRIQEHREWMTRSYALVLAAVTLRIYLPILEGLLGEQDGYALVAWLCWVPNLIVAEAIVRSWLRRSPERSFATA